MAKTPYNEDIHPMLIQSLLQNGLTLEQVAEKLDITTVTLLHWRQKYPSVKEAVIKGREPVDANVVAALYKSAMGYTYKETILEPAKLTKKQIEAREKMKNPPPIPMVRKRAITKHISPNVIAQIFWLKNRLPEEWKDRQNVNIAGKVEYTIKLPPMPPDVKKVGESVIKPEEKEIKAIEKTPEEIKLQKDSVENLAYEFSLKEDDIDDSVDISKEL